MSGREEWERVANFETKVLGFYRERSHFSNFKGQRTSFTSV